MPSVQIWIRLNESQRFWTSLFEETQLASKIFDVAAAEEKGQYFHVKKYGNVLVKSKPASALGDNFMSDTFTIEATLEDGTSYISFIKVMSSKSIDQIQIKLNQFLGFALQCRDERGRVCIAGSSQGDRHVSDLLRCSPSNSS